jgi:diguanylate cyclase (GGDEF)-like protein
VHASAIATQSSSALSLQAVIDAIADEIAVIDQRGLITMVNAAWNRFATANGGDPANVGVGVDYLRLCEQDAKSMIGVAIALRELLAGKRRYFQMDYPCDAPTMERHYSMRAVRMEVGVLIVHKDVTYLRSSERAVAAAANLDPLTHALNRLGLAAQLAMETARARALAVPLSAVAIDCDNFRAINAHHGLAIGDVVLAEMVARIRECVRPDDAIARISGDQFVVLLRDQDLQAAAQIAERIRLSVCLRPVSESHGPVLVTVNATVLRIDPAIESLDSLLRDVDASIRRSKRRGRNRVSATKAPDPEARSRSVRISDAIVDLRVAAQDLVTLEHGDQIGVELLVRGPRGEFESPVDLFRAAVDCGLLGTLDEACLRACMAQAHRFGDRDVHINVYPSTLLSLWPARLVDFLSAGAHPETICLELCEQQVIGPPAYLIERLRALRDLGFRIAVDDVGFGRSCLENLIVLEPDIVKIDRCFVHGASDHRHMARNLGRLIRVAKTLGATVVVEGVECVADAEIACEMGAEFGQGYLWSRPRLLDPSN